MIDKILQTAQEEIGKYGFRKFTIEGIAQNLGISKKTLYKYFKSKDELISYIVDTHIELEKQYTLDAVSMEGTWIEKIRRIVSHRACENSYNYIAELQRFYPEEWLKSRQLSKLNREKLLELIREGISLGGVNPEVLKLFPIIEVLLDIRLIEIVDYEFGRNNDITFFQAIEGFVDIILYGIIKREESN